MRILGFVILFTIKMVCPASAMVGGAQEIPAAHTQPEVMFVGSSGNFCTGVAIARDLVLTAAHCVHAGDSYKLVELDFNDKPILKDTVAVARHPQFNLKTMLAHRAKVAHVIGVSLQHCMLDVVIERVAVADTVLRRTGRIAKFNFVETSS
jgi:hypothetical protein